MIPGQHVQRVLAWLIRNEGVAPEAILRAVNSIQDMSPGQIIALSGDPNAVLRGAFVREQTRRLEEPDPNRFVAFTAPENAALRDGLLTEADLDPAEDPQFPARVATADALIAELDRAVALITGECHG